MTLQGVIEEIKSWELPFYAEPSRKKVIETISADVVRITAERDTAIEDLKNLYSPHGNCHLCKHNKERMTFDCMHKCIRDGMLDISIDYLAEDYLADCWEWRGVK